MPRTCAAFGCTNNDAKDICKEKNISFHRFPLKKAQCKQWLIKLRRKDFAPTEYSLLCSEHFTEDCFTYQPFTNRRGLKPGAIPTLFTYARTSKLKRTSFKFRKSVPQPSTSNVSSDCNESVPVVAQVPFLQPQQKFKESELNGTSSDSISENHGFMEKKSHNKFTENKLENTSEEFRFSTSPNFEDIRILQREFVNNRNWDKYHTPRNLLLALVAEVGELSEIFQWKDEVMEGLPDWNEGERKHLGEELSDVFLYLLRLSEKCHVDLPTAVLQKMSQNEKKYPVSKVWGSSKKYSEYE